MTIRTALVILLTMWFITSVSNAQLPTSDKALEAVFLDLQNEPNPKLYRYIWVQYPNMLEYAKISYSVNAIISQSSVSFTPNDAFGAMQMLHDGGLYKLNMLVLAGGDEDKFIELCNVWDRFIDHRLYRTLLVLEEKKEKITIPVNKSNGQISDEDIEAIIKEASTDKVLAEFLPREQIEFIHQATAAKVPVVSYHFFYNGGMRQDNGRLYYSFKGFPPDRKNPEGKTDKDLVFEKQGIQADKATFFEFMQRVATIFSEVTSGPRVVEFHSGMGRLGINQGIVASTLDPFRENVENDVRYDPLKDLLNFEHDGEEVFVEQPNGLIATYLFNNKGDLVDEAPPNLVTDHEIPRPYHAILSGHISCLRCHEEGWLPVSNDVRDEFSSGFGIIADAKTRDTIFSLYGGDATTILQRANQDLNRAIVRCTFPAMKTIVDPSTGQTSKVPLEWRDISKAFREEFEYFQYSKVDVRKACLELGYDPGKDARETFRKLVGVMPAGTEDRHIARLRDGKIILRHQWNFIIIDAALREQEIRRQISEKEANNGDESGS